MVISLVVSCYVGVLKCCVCGMCGAVWVGLVVMWCVGECVM